MMPSQLFSTRLRRVAAGSVALLALAACSDAPNAPTPTGPNLTAVGRDDDLGPALAAQAKHTNRLMSDREILGTAVGRLNDGRPEVTVFAKNASAAARIASQLDGIPVTVEVTGEITTLPAVASPRARPGGGTSNTSFFNRPVPIGVSTGRADQCASGTIGARVNGGGALSNNHVFAKENLGRKGDLIYQPGRYDLSCDSDDDRYGLATLDRFVAINFNGGNNVVDGAIASPVGNAFDNKTPPSCYGTPSSSTMTATLNMAVQKCGRTTGLTTGVVVGVNVTVNVQYSRGIAKFVNQVQIRGDGGQFSRAGDSGSLIVTQSGNQPVALLFAGGGSSTFANPIGAVLSELNVSIDGN